MKIEVIIELVRKLSLEAYSRPTDGVEAALDEADRYASENEKRYTHEEVFKASKDGNLNFHNKM